MSESTENDSQDGKICVRTRQRSRQYSGDSLKDRRRHSQTLTPLIIPDTNSVFTIPWRKRSRHESVKEESTELFEHFVCGEIEREHLDIPNDLTSTCASSIRCISLCI